MSTHALAPSGDFGSASLDDSLDCLELVDKLCEVDIDISKTPSPGKPSPHPEGLASGSVVNPFDGSPILP